MRMSVKPGDRLAFELDDRGALHAVPVRDSGESLYGFLAEHATKSPANTDAFDQGIARRMIEKFGPN